MIKSIMVENHKNEQLLLTLANPEPSGLYVKSVEGLGPGNATVSINEIASIDGGVFGSARKSSRNIVLTLGMMFCPLIEDARHKTYQFFPLKKPIRLIVTTDYRTTYIDGYVESNEPDIFSEEETTQISILCPNPWFYDIGNSSLSFSGVQDAFEFPFSNESLTERLITFGEISNSSVVDLRYQGDVDTGILMKLRFSDNLSSDLTIYNVGTNESMTLHLGKVQSITDAAISKKDEIEISTFSGSKYIYLIRDGQYHNLFGVLDPITSWFTLSGGSNFFAFDASGHNEAVSIQFTYKNMYGGI